MKERINISEMPIDVILELQKAKPPQATEIIGNFLHGEIFPKDSKPIRQERTPEVMKKHIKRTGK